MNNLIKRIVTSFLLLFILSTINADGKTKISPSILSSKPPCPGNILPVSFTFAFLLK